VRQAPAEAPGVGPAVPARRQRLVRDRLQVGKERKRNLLEKGEKEPASTEAKETAPATKEPKPEGAARPKSRTMVSKPAKAAAGRKPKPASKKTSSARARKR